MGGVWHLYDKEKSKSAGFVSKRTNCMHGFATGNGVVCPKRGRFRPKRLPFWDRINAPMGYVGFATGNAVVYPKKGRVVQNAFHFGIEINAPMGYVGFATGNAVVYLQNPGMWGDEW